MWLLLKTLVKNLLKSRVIITNLFTQQKRDENAVDSSGSFNLPTPRVVFVYRNKGNNDLFLFDNVSWLSFLKFS